MHFVVYSNSPVAWVGCGCPEGRNHPPQEWAVPETPASPELRKEKDRLEELRRLSE
jgi:hypothetical protein